MGSRNLNKEILKIKGRTTKGLIEASIIIRRDMDQRPPVIPVGDTGNLRASWFTTIGTTQPTPGGGFKGEDSGKMSGDHKRAVGESSAKANSYPYPTLVMGFSANYGVPVHEMLGNINWNRPGSGGLFFESSLQRNQKTVLTVIAKNVKRF